VRPSPPVAAAFLVALALRVGLLVRWPANIGLDGFQRWAGRDWLLVQEWLPATQGVVWAVAKIGGGPLEARVAMAVVAAAATAAGAALVEAVAGRTAAWAFVAIGAYAPFLVWTTALYQEGTFLLVAFAGLALAATGRPRLGDVVIGAVGLVRYEGWPLVALYVLWRRDPRALVAGWGAVAWLAGRAAFGWEGHRSSPIDYFADWDGIADRFSWEAWGASMAWLGERAWRTGALLVLALGAAGAWIGRRRAEVVLVVATALVQIAFVAVWMVGLERATYRMLVLPVVLAGVPAAIAAAAAWERARATWARAGLVAALLGGVAYSVKEADDVTRGEMRWTRPERDALAAMAACPDCRWYVVPRTGIGPRDRHDGCELLQGVSTLRHGEDYWCAAWPEGAGGEALSDGVVAWDGKSYTVTTRTAR
jgi:hypothetical protein